MMAERVLSPVSNNRFDGCQSAQTHLNNFFFSYFLGFRVFIPCSSIHDQ